MSIPFLSSAAILALVALAWLLRPLLWRKAAAPSASRQALNAAIYRDQLAELESDRTNGTLADNDFEQARTELQRRLLQDAAVADVAVPAAAPAKRTALALALLLPLAAALLYALLGHPAAMQATPSQHEITAGQMDEMIAKLAARLEKEPNNPQGWAMLARSYKAISRFDEAEKAFQRAGDMLNSDPQMLCEYADLLAVRANGNLEGKPLELVKAALKLDPMLPMGLALAGTAAYNRQDFPEAVRFWEQLLSTLPPDSEDAAAISATLGELRGKSPGKVAAKAAPGKPEKAAAGKSISGSVTLAPALAGKVQPGDTLFVYARPVDGSRMPLALLRASASDLPLTFTLDDSLALSPEQKLSLVKEARLEARVSKSGQAVRQPGDLVGESGTVKLGAKGVKLSIDRVTQ
ncbi:MAG: c-type cytochrome biogenesis protein CcmI [Betaproteobacteria bacterium]|nr:c-type cytochrome biogenesis protein CcmI [Betaproteobacteria bacterium]